jgi:tubulin epsilon
MSDVQRNLARLRPQLRLPFWNPDGIKVGLCAAPPVGLPHAILSLSNSCAMTGVLDTLLSRFDRLYRRKAHVHHFSQYIDASHLATAREALLTVREQYASMHDQTPPPAAQQLLDRLVNLN